jgi:hypothetical protein
MQRNISNSYCSPLTYCYSPALHNNNNNNTTTTFKENSSTSMSPSSMKYRKIENTNNKTVINKPTSTTTSIEPKKVTTVPTPQSIIQKFEALSRDKTEPTTLTSNTAVSIERSHSSNVVPSLSQPVATSTLKSSSAANINNKNQKYDVVDNGRPSTSINTDPIKPQSIIQKFESLVKQNAINAQKDLNVVNQLRHAHQNQNKKQQQQQRQSDCESTASGSVYRSNPSSLTFISSILSSTVNVSPKSDKQIVINDETLENEQDGEESAIYDEFIIETTTTNNQEEEEGEEEDEESEEGESEDDESDEDDIKYVEEGDQTSLFENSQTKIDINESSDTESETPPVTTVSSCSNKRTRSISISSSNSDRTDADIDVDDELDAIYNGVNFRPRSKGISPTNDQQDDELSNKTDENLLAKHLDDTNCTSVDSASSVISEPVSTLSTITETDNNSYDQSSTVGLFSLMEYRKQNKRGFNHLTDTTGTRRSSIMTKAGVTGNQRTTTKNSTNISSLVGGSITTALNATTKLSTNDSALNEKKNKYMNRIKELEDLIRQEDNIIHQSGTALEKCISNPQFTGSSEHVECNRILLISCKSFKLNLISLNFYQQI